MAQTLFLLMRHIDCEGSEIAECFHSLERALDGAEVRMRGGDCYSDSLTVRAVEPGCGRGVEVARWRQEHPPWDIWPCDGEGPPSEDPNPRWERVL